MKNQDAQHLDLLAIFYYIMGGTTALLSCTPLIFAALGIATLSGLLEGGDAPPRVVGWFLVLFAALFILGGWALGAATIIAGRKLQKRNSHTYCIVIAAIMCLNMPLGTALGIFTIIVLMRPSVKELFAAT